ncbi:MAG: hypothetical protein WC607_04815 [Candidatus Micrarchaeia archaeon]
MAERKADELESVKNDVRSLSSKVDLIIQKIGNIEKNEQVLGRTVVALNDKTKKLGEAAPAQQQGGGAPDLGALDKRYALKADLQEIKYTLDMVNPLQFATVDQVKELIADAKKK